MVLSSPATPRRPRVEAPLPVVADTSPVVPSVVPVPARPRVRLRLIDGFELVRGDAVVDLPVPAQRVLAFLALTRRSLHREYVAGTLWGDRDQQRAAANLRSALWRLREVPEVVHATRTHLRLGSEVELDVGEVEALARRVLAAGTASAPCEEVDADPAGCAGALDRDLLPDWYDDWAQFERERLRQLRIGALEQLSVHWRHLGRFALAVDAALAAIRAEPMREGAHAALIEAHLAAGNRNEALRRYEHLRMLLQSELGLRPSTELQRRVAAVIGERRRVVSSSWGWNDAPDPPLAARRGRA